MTNTHTKVQFSLHSNAAAIALCGHSDEHLRLLEEAFAVRIFARGIELTIKGKEASVHHVIQILSDLRTIFQRQATITRQEVERAIHLRKDGASTRLSDLQKQSILITAKGQKITPRTVGQRDYIHAVQQHDVVFSIGPAGTGKTYLAIALAVAALQAKSIQKIILTRPAVEAGEKLGFLPGDLQEKVDPYLRPLYDALYETLGVEEYHRCLERGIIEIAPLAYMRGRTLESAFVILDEAQNTTPEQMKMFLTRLGIGSKMVITGDITQIDLPNGQQSGLRHAYEVLRAVPGVAFQTLTERDVVRHELVKRIIRAYDEQSDQSQASSSAHSNTANNAVTPAASQQEDEKAATHTADDPKSSDGTQPPVEAV